MTGRLRTAALVTILAVVASGCWYHRVDVPNPVMPATMESKTVWGTLWRSATITPGTTCPSGMFKEVVVRSNWGFSLIRVATLGLLAPARVDRHCARAEILDQGVPPNTQPSAEPGGATYLSVLYGVGQLEPSPRCNQRGLEAVQVRPNPLFDLVSAVTVGLVSPIRLGWRCVPAPEAPGQGPGGGR